MNLKSLPEGVANAVLLLMAPHSEVKTLSDLELLLSSDQKGDQILTQKECEKTYKISFWTLHRAEKAGKLKVLRAGRKRLYRSSDVEKYLMGD